MMENLCNLEREKKNENYKDKNLKKKKIEDVKWKISSIQEKIMKWGSLIVFTCWME